MILAISAQWEDFPAFCSAAFSSFFFFRPPSLSLPPSLPPSFLFSSSSLFSREVLRRRSEISQHLAGLGRLGSGYLPPLVCPFIYRTDGQTDGSARSLFFRASVRYGAVQQEKMARFLALFLTAAYECARAACICRGHGSGCRARTRAASVHAPARRAGTFFMKRSGKGARRSLGPRLGTGADFGSSRRKCSNPDYAGMRRTRPDVHALRQSHLQRKSPSQCGSDLCSGLKYGNIRELGRIDLSLSCRRF
jgi:hypothetical protein